MKLILQDNRIAATATDDYAGADAIQEPADFDILLLDKYRLVDGALLIPAPKSCSMRQARLALLGAGLLPQINDALAAMPGIEGDAARIEWEFATEVRRDSSLVSGLSATLGLSSEQLDGLFVAASEL